MNYTRIVAIGDGTSPEYDGYRIKFYEANEGQVTRCVRQAFDEGAYECLLNWHRQLKLVKRGTDGSLKAVQIRHHELRPYLTMHIDQQEDQPEILTKT